MSDVKIVAAYLPQFHEIPENNEWWGKGYTDWVAVKKSRPVFENHYQPRVPLNNNYYSLDDVETIRWQADIARKYGVYGFGIYHYWFSDNQQLLTKPAEIILSNTDIEINYCFMWDNNSWVNKTWKNIRFANQWAPKFEKYGKKNNDSGVLAELKYGYEKSWEKHYQYLKPFFSDRRYIKYRGKPIFGIMQPSNEYTTLQNMCSYINDLAQKDGFPGVLFLTAANFSRKKIDMDYRYEPFDTCSPLDLIRRKIKEKNKLKLYKYDIQWRKILFNAHFFASSDTFYGGFVGFDDTPRRGDKARIILGQSPEKFEKYMKELLNISNEQGKEYVFLTAWNEWGEGAYLEPDTKDGYAYLEALKRAIDSVDSENV